MNTNSPDPEFINATMTAYAARFGSEAQCIAQAPGRVNLLGEHTDYTGGLVLPIAINRWTLVAAGGTSTNESRLRAEDMDAEYGFDVKRPIRKSTSVDLRFANHLLGILEGLRDLSTPSQQLNILASGNIPIGAGVSSSAALEVATLRACESFFDLHLDELTAARIAQRTEHEFVGTPCGIMDMLVSLAAEENHALLIDCSTLKRTSIALPPTERMGILLVDTGVKHDLATSGYAECRASCERVQDASRHPLAKMDLDMLAETDIDEPDQRRARHVIEENARVSDAVTALGEENLEWFGDLLFQGHASLRDLFDVSVPELDLIVETAESMKNQGIYGARMTGGGFGGSAIVVHDPAARQHIIESINKAFNDGFGRTPNSFPVNSVSGASRIQ